MGQLDVIHAAGGGGGEAEAGTHAGPAWEDRVAHGKIKEGRRRAGMQRPLQHGFEARESSHVFLHHEV
jgi:hypothetical protein